MAKYDEQKTEQDIIDAGKTGPRITPDKIDACIVYDQYYVFPGTQLTVCCLTLRNGFTVTGESACADPANFSEKIGRSLAYGQARNKIWQLEGYLLKERLYHARTSSVLTF